MKRRPAANLLPSLLLFLGACVGSGGGDAFPMREPLATPSSDAGPVIGLVGTMSGPDGRRGTHAFEGADLAVQTLNQDRDPGTLPFQLVTLDDKGDPEDASAMVEDLAASDRTVGIVYAGPLEGLPPAEAALAQADIPAVLCFGDLSSPGLLRDHLFQVSPPLEWQARRIASYFRRDRGYRNIGLIAAETFEGKTAVDAMRSAARASGTRVVVSRYEDGPEIRREVFRPLRKKVEAIVFHGRPAGFSEVVALLDAEDSLYRSTEGAREAPVGKKGRRGRHRSWRPHLAAFDGAFAAVDPGQSKVIPAGTVVAESYARGAYYLPVESFERFRGSFENWWDSPPVGWQRRGYEAARLIGWAARRAEPEEDVARVLESLSGLRFGGTTVDFGADDHVSPEPTAIGLWVKPRPGIPVRERNELAPGLPWVPLARGFSSDGITTDVESADWDALFEGPFRGRAPSVTRSRYGVTTLKRDPIH